MNEDKVRKAFDVASECAAKCPQEFSREAFAEVFRAMTYEPIAIHHDEPTPIERFLNATGGLSGAIHAQQSDPTLFGKIAKLFDVEI